ncbi:lysine-ketoglutarate reductase/saccharopine dehydrogenase bifunctional enzyme [Forsythia ovata]|uniref:Lysine-ketoglutarate reductase/saccharopine dehydrogenase bifunctional enzyme n=1 Tax=Forsythia ovata TaxID=205694 RepID=A0ABD1PLK3_9LAMI
MGFLFGLCPFPFPPNPAHHHSLNEPRVTVEPPIFRSHHLPKRRRVAASLRWVKRACSILIRSLIRPRLLREVAVGNFSQWAKADGAMPRGGRMPMGTSFSGEEAMTVSSVCRWLFKSAVKSQGSTRTSDDKLVLDKIIDSLTSLANPNENHEFKGSNNNAISLKVGRFKESKVEMEYDTKKKAFVLILGAGQSFRTDDLDKQACVQVIVASLFLKDAEENELERLFFTLKESNFTILECSLLPPSCHSIVAGACIQLKKHLVTASYVDDSTSKLDEMAKSSGVTILCEMGLDPGIDHMMAMKMINHVHVRGGRIKSFISYCGGFPSPEAANNPLAYKFSWSPAGAIRAGRNPATYRYHGEVVHVGGEDLYDSANRFRLADFPAFALECLPNRDSLVYGDLYGIGNEASTIFHGTLRYEGIGSIMGTLARIGFFSTEVIPILEDQRRLAYRTFLLSLLNIRKGNLDESTVGEKDITESIVSLGLCKET